MILYMKIALMTPTLSMGGAEKVMLNLAKGFYNEGHSVFLVCGTFKGEYSEQIPGGIKVIDLGVNRMRFSLLPLIKFLKNHKPDVLYTAFRLNNVIALLAKMIIRSNVKVYVSEHGFEHIPNNISGEIKALIYRYLYSKAERIITVSRGLSHFVAKELTISPLNIVTIYNPVIDEDNNYNSKADIGEEWFRNRQVPVILSVGRLAKIKGYQDLLKTFNEIIKYKDARLVIIGEGPYRSELEKIIHELHLQDNVRLMGYVENPYPYMELSSVLVLTSYKEGFGNVLVEGLYCGAQVVSTDCPSGPNEILMNGKFGTLVPVGDSTSLEEAITNIIDKKKIYKNGKIRAKEFTINKICKEYLQLFESGK